MKTYVKKPVKIEAVQWDGLTDTAERIAQWSTGKVVRDRGGNEDTLVVDTLEGRMTAVQSDWIIRGVEGEFYPCKNAIFQKTYDAAETA